MKQYYTIKEVSRRTGISEHTLRYYDKEGLMPFITHGENGIRLFTKEDFEHLYTITVLKKVGMPLKSIREFMGLYLKGNSTIHERYEMYYQQKKALEEKIQELHKMLEFVDMKCDFFKEAEKNGDMEYYKKLPSDQVDLRILNYQKEVEQFFEGEKKEAEI